MPTPCFWVDATGDETVGLRRYRSGDTCPLPGGYHNAVVPIGRQATHRDERGYAQAIDASVYAGDPRWPVACACGEAFRDADQWQVYTERIWRAADGREFADRSLPPGAMLDGWWHPQKGPDGIALVVVLPPMTADTRGDRWHVDGPSSTGRADGAWGPCWTRTGDPKATPPTVSATPSILTGSYHGFLTSGVLTDSL